MLLHMKLGKLGIFLILLLSLLFAGLGVSTYELMTNRREGYDNGDTNTSATSLAISEDQPPPNNPNTTPTSGPIPVEQNTSSSVPQDSSPEDSSSTPQDSSPEDSSSTPQTSDSTQSNQSVDDQYILKSQIVPPVCPKCPDAASCPRPKPCPPCAPCARCPEPAFECKKVPSYQGGPYPMMPKPVLNDFSQFGM